MKRICFFLIGIIILGCSNREDEEEIIRSFNEETLEISAKDYENTFYKYQVMESYPTEGGPVITKEPKNASVSELKHDNGIYYVYQPKAGFTGTDKVEITNNISAGGSDIVAKDILTLTIVVRD